MAEFLFENVVAFQVVKVTMTEADILEALHIK